MAIDDDPVKALKKHFELEAVSSLDLRHPTT